MPITSVDQPQALGMQITMPEVRKKVLVTGGCGFLGSYVCELFAIKGWEVLAYDNLTKFEFSRVPYFDVEKVRDYNLHYLESIGVPTIIADILDTKTLNRCARGASLIAHCAAQPAMTVAIENPFLDMQTNIQGTLNVLEAARQAGAAVINCSTIHVYGNGRNEDLREEETRFEYPSGFLDEICEFYGTVSPLHASKLSAEHYVQAYIDTYNLKAATFRLTGIYGPRQFGGEDHGWVANFAIRTLLNLPTKVFGTDKQVRDILFVRDAAMAFLEWYEKGCPPGVYNIGGGPQTSISIKEYFDLLQVLTGRTIKATLEPARQGDLWWFVSDCNKAKKAFGWKPQVLPREGVRELLTWISKNKELFK